MAVDNNDDGIGKTIIFRPNLEELGSIKSDDTFEVQLRGIKKSGRDAGINYNVHFFDLPSEMEKAQVSFTVRHASRPLPEATILINGEALLPHGILISTDQDGIATFRLPENEAYSYIVTKDGYSVETGDT